MQLVAYTLSGAREHAQNVICDYFNSATFTCKFFLQKTNIRFGTGLDTVAVFAKPLQLFRKRGSLVSDF